MKIERTFDMNVVDAIIKHPMIYPHVHDDSVKEFYPQDHDGFYWMLVSEEKPVGVFLVHATNSSCYEIHTCLLPEIWGDKANKAARLVGDYIFYELGAKKIVTNVPRYNKHAFRFAKTNGMQMEGVNRKSYLHNGKLEDQIFLGVTIEEWELCQQQSL